MTVLPSPFPDPLRVRVEFAFGAPHDAAPQLWTWTVVNDEGEDDIKSSTGVPLRFGRSDRQTRLTTSEVQFVLDDDHAVYTPDHPLSPHYGKMSVGTPVRVTPILSDDADEQFVFVEGLTDTFTRTLDGGSQWGRPDFGPGWTTTLHDPDETAITVDGTRGIITYPAPSLFASNETILTSWEPFLDGEIQAGIAAGQTSNTEDLVAGVGYRGSADFGAYAAELYFHPDGNVSVALAFDNDILIGLVIDVLAYTPGDLIRIRVRVEGINHKVRVWNDGDPEPAVWNIDLNHDPQTSDSEPVAPGFRPGPIQVYSLSFDDAPNSTVEFDDIIVHTPPPVWYGHVGSWDVSWPEGDIAQAGFDPGDPTDMSYPGYTITEVTANGVLRRISQSNIIGSALARSVPSTDGILAYWPMEETSNTGTFASGLPDGAPMVVGEGAAFATVNQWNGSESLASFAGGDGGFNGVVTRPHHGRWRADWLYWQRDAVTGAAIVAMWIRVGSTLEGDVRSWVIYITSAHQVRVRAYNNAGDNVHSTDYAFDADDFYDRGLRFSFIVATGGGGAEYDLEVTQLDGLSPVTVLTASGTVVGADVEANFPTEVLTRSTLIDATERAWGHITLTGQVIITADPFADGAADGFQDERAADRFARICTELGVPYVLLGAPQATERMGPERVGDLIGTFQDIENVDGGIIHESFDSLGLTFRPRSSLTNQTPHIELDARPAGFLRPEIRPPLLPSLDDRDAANDVVAARTGGGSVRLIDATDIALRGEYSLQADVNVASVSQLEDIASWFLLLGTWPGLRHRQITLALADAWQRISDWIGIREGDLIRVRNLPPQHPPGPIEVLVYGSARRMLPLSWDEALSTEVAGPYAPGMIEGNGDGDETIGQRYDSARSYLTENIDATDTSFVVATPVLRPLNSATDFESPFVTAPTEESAWETSAGVADFSRSVDQAFSGSWSGQATPTGATTTADLISDTDIGAGTAYQTFDGYAWLYTESANVQAQAALLFTGDPYPTQISSVTGSTVALTPGVWTRVFVSGSTTSLVNGVRLRIRLTAVAGNLLATDIVWVDYAEVGMPGQPWVNTTDHAAEFPFSVGFGGETMTATAITSPTAARLQTFTVTRSANGVEKAHTQGVPVKLSAPMRFDANGRTLR